MGWRSDFRASGRAGRSGRIVFILPRGSAEVGHPAHEFSRRRASESAEFLDEMGLVKIAAVGGHIGPVNRRSGQVRRFRFDVRFTRGLAAPVSAEPR